MEDNDAQLQLKKRARRRLVGAVAFASVVAVVLPMIMDHQPRQPVPEVEIRIPGQDEKPFAPKFAVSPIEKAPQKIAPLADSAPAEAKGDGEAAPEKPPAKPLEAAPEKVPAKAPEKSEKPPAKPEKPAAVRPATPGAPPSSPASRRRPRRRRPSRANT
jgi:DedD protein